MSKRTIIFLRDVFAYTLSAFGGPQAHFALMLRQFVIKRKYLNENELIELNALCQMLPGPASTQTLVAIAFRFGGYRVAIFAFFIWILPSACLMAIAAICFSYFDLSTIAQSRLQVIQAMAVGIIGYAGFKLSLLFIKSIWVFLLALFSFLATIYFRTPYVFPIILLVGATLAAIFNKLEPDQEKYILQVNWKKLLLFIGILLLFALMGMLINRTSFFSLPVRLFENFYRNGILVFGGGQVLIPMLYTEFVELKKYLTAQEFLSAVALQQAMPGPVFSFTSFVGSITMRNYGIAGQILGAIIAVIAINLPGMILILFIYPIWDNLKKIQMIKQSFKGINAVSVGFVFAAFFLLLKPIGLNYINVLIIGFTFSLLMFTKIPPWVIIIGGICISFLL